MAKMDVHEKVFNEMNSQPQGRTGAKVNTKPGPAVRGQPMHPNGGEPGGVFRAARGKVTK
jgi:hypothetical protein